MKFSPVIRSKHLITSSTKFVEVLKISITKLTRIYQINVYSNNDAVTVWRISFNPQDYEVFSGNTPKSFKFPEQTFLSKQDEILIEVRSTDGTTIGVDADVSLGIKIDEEIKR